MEKTVRRRSDPLMCQYLWDAITTIRNHKQLPSFDRIRRYMNRTHSMEPGKKEYNKFKYLLLQFYYIKYIFLITNENKGYTNTVTLFSLSHFDIIFSHIDKVEKHLDECTLDNLIIVSRKVGQKGSKVGVEQEGFRLPTPPVSS